MATKNQKSKFLYVGVIVVAITIVFFAFKMVGEKEYLQVNPSAPILNDSKIYTSNALKFSINVPDNYVVEDNGVTINLKFGDRTISIVRNGTNYSSLNDYLQNFDSRRELIILDTTSLSINGSDAVSRIVKISEENITQKSYYIYSNYAVYILSSTSSNLYGDLDKIARSFRYTP